MNSKADVIMIGAGLCGLVDANELAKKGKRVILIDHEGEQIWLDTQTPLLDFEKTEKK